MVVGKPLVSIIMNCYNSDHFLREAIESVYDQTYSNWEIIFWDNASTDSSPEIAKSYDDRLKYFRNNTTTNLGMARKLAMKKTSGKYISFLDCDDIYLCHKLEAQVKLMESGVYAMCYGGSMIIDESGLVFQYKKAKNNSGYIFRNLLKHYEINMQSVMLDSSILSKYGYDFSDKLKYSPDYDLFMKISSERKVAVYKDYLVKYRISKNSLSVSSVDIIAMENKYTLDYLHAKNPKKYKKEFSSAYKKLKYYEIISALYKKDKKKAIGIVKKIFLSRYQFMFLYILLLLPINSKTILTLLKRPG
jgi:glycosyltransferase involved in cell wall biosynthesis